VKPPAEYSILKPETSSDSPSAKSNGVRLVSATALNTQKNNNPGEIKANGSKEFKIQILLNLVARAKSKMLKKISASLNS